jgi:hypothetical protein
MVDFEFESSFDLESTLNDEGVKFRANATHYILYECPNCGGREKLFIDKKKKLWICYKCCLTDQADEHKEGRGNLWSLLLTIGIDELQVKKIFQNRKRENYAGDFVFEKLQFTNCELEQKEKKEKIHVDIPHYYLKLDCSDFQITNFFEVYNYLWKRNVRTKNQILNHDLHYDIFNKRIVFPAYTIDGFRLGIQSRDITDRFKSKHLKCVNVDCDTVYKYYFMGESYQYELCPTCNQPLNYVQYPKSLNTRNFAKTEFFYNENNVDWSQTITLVEGPFDCINTPNSLAFLGKVLSDTQQDILLKYIKKDLVLYLDGDEPGVFSAAAIYQQLRAFFNIRMVSSKNGDDPGTFSLQENQTKISLAKKPEDWFIENKLIYM